MTDYLTDFVQESEERITELNNALLTLERDPTDDDAMENIFRVAHTLKGNCGAMGLESASDLAHAIEDLLDAVRRGELEVTPELMDVVFDAVDELETMIDEVADDGEIETDPSETIAALRGQLEAEEGPPSISAPSTDEIDDVIERFEPPADDEHQAYLVRLSIAESDEVNNGKLVVDALIDAFDLIGTEPPQSEIEAGDYPGQFDAVFGSAVGEAAIASGLEPVEEVADFELVDVSDRFAARADEPDDAAEAAAEPGEGIDPDDAADLEVDELLDEFDEFDDLDEMVEDVDDDELEAFENMGEAGSFDDLLDDDEIEIEGELGEPAVDPIDENDGDEAATEADDESAADEPADDEDVEDANAVFNELKDEVEMVGFDELQDELEELEFDEFDNDDEVDMDELIGDDVDVDDDAFLDDAEPSDAAVDDILVEADDATESPLDDGSESADDADADDVDESLAADDAVDDGEPVAVEPETEPDDADAPIEAESETEPGDTDAPAADAESDTDLESDVEDLEGDSDTDLEGDADDSDEESPIVAEPADGSEPVADDAPAETAEAVDADDPADDGADEPTTVEVSEPADADAADEVPVAGDAAEPSTATDPAADADAGAETDADADLEPDEPVDAADDSAAVDADDSAAVDADDAVEADELDSTSDAEEADGALDEPDDELGETTDDAVAAASDPATESDTDDSSATADESDDDFETSFEDGFEPTTAVDDGSVDDDGDDPFGDEAVDEDPFATDDEGDDPFAVADDPFADEADDAFADDDFDTEFETVDDGFDDGVEATDAADDPVGDALDGLDDSFDEADGSVDAEAAADSSAEAPSFDDDARADADDASEDVVHRIEEPTLESPEITIPERDERPDADQQTDEIQSVRVDVEQIDSLLTLVEGLVTSRVRLRHAATESEDSDALETELDALEDLTTELQETVMDIRLVPLQTVANRLPRVVRDIARDQDKEVAFEMTGEDVELDRSILDRIGDPLIHLVRNAVDHGIEPPEEREAADKPREGSVEVHADRARDRVTITVEDDGSGLDPDRLRSEAVEADVLSEDEAADLSDEEAYELVFHPGLSTADEVTDVSGRGVGMDVVKRTIEDLDGTVAVDSEVGEGTSITMTLPVSVAIDDILFVESGGEEFGLPTKAVLDIEPADNLETVDGRPMLADGDDDASVIRLDEALETPQAGANGDGMVVRIRDDVRSVALHCDHVHGQQEVVVKPFEGFMSDIPGLSGATVRGRGEVVNILDVTTL